MQPKYGWFLDHFPLWNFTYTKKTFLFTSQRPSNRYFQYNLASVSFLFFFFLLRPSINYNQWRSWCDSSWLFPSFLSSLDINKWFGIKIACKCHSENPWASTFILGYRFKIIWRWISLWKMKEFLFWTLMFSYLS